jgi:hypothetical protein
MSEHQPEFECSVCDYTSDEYGDTHTHARVDPPNGGAS